MSDATPLPPEDTGHAELQALEAQMRQLEAQGRNGASWFYWAAALSVVNSALVLFGAPIRFVFGLGLTELGDAFGAAIAEENPEAAMLARGLSLGFSLLMAGGLCFFGWAANKRYIPLFAIGIGLYLLDGLLLLRFQELYSAAFHAFVLFQMWQGLSAYRQLSGILRTNLNPAA